MQSAKTSIIAGIVLMAVGGLLLLDLLGVLKTAAVLPTLIFAAVGLLFAFLFVRGREYWWAAIPASVFLGLAAVITAAQLTGGDRAGTYLFLFLAVGFAAVYLRLRANWWALIPSGVMFTLALIIALPPEFQGTAVAAVLFLGLAATFGLLSLVPVQHPGEAVPAARMKWPLIPAALLGILGLIFALQAMSVLLAADFALPAALVLAGIGLLIYAYRASRGGHTPHGA